MPERPSPVPTTDPTLLCFGYGYCARALGSRLAIRGWRVIGTSRQPSAGDGLLRFDRDHPLDPALVRSATHILSSVPPDAAGDPVLDRHHGDFAEASWIGYLSTTSVYGDRQGGWVDEATEPAPSSARGGRRLAAEMAWDGLRRDQGLPVHRFRLAGIYGPGRSPLEKLRQGESQRIVKPGQVFGRIHVDDIVSVLEASMVRPRPGAVYNVTDDEPAPPDIVIEEAARLLGIAPPPAIPFETADLSPMAREFYSETKRVSNQLIREELGVELAYPTYREGLRSLV